MSTTRNRRHQPADMTLLVALNDKLDALTSMVTALVARDPDSKLDEILEVSRNALGRNDQRLNKQQMAQRMGCCAVTLRHRIKDGIYPKPDADGRWSLANLIKWEQRQQHAQHATPAHHLTGDHHHEH